MKPKIALFAVLLTALFVALPVQARIYLGPSPPPLPFKAYITATATPPPSGPPPWYMEVYGSGVATLMGHVTVYQHHLVVPAADGGVDFYDGYWLWTAANGDELFGTYSGHMPLNPAGYFEIQGYFYIEGGTGRFLHATGEGPASGVQYMDGTAVLILDGTINYW